MPLDFPNASRSYDERRHLVRFWGYDSALEVSFFVELDALHKLMPKTEHIEADCLEVFDAVRDRILEAACKAYTRRRPGPYLLVADDF